MADLVEQLSGDQRLATLGFEFFPLSDAARAEPDALWIIGTARVGRSALALGLEAGRLFALLGNQKESIDIPLAPTVEAVLAIAALYVVPGRQAPSEPPLLNLAKVRKERARTHARLAGGDVKVLRRFLATGDYDDSMVALENAMTSSPYLAFEVVTQASAHRRGRLSQNFTTFSGSVFGYERTRANGQGWFVVEAQYRPAKRSPEVQQHLSAFAPPCETPLPDDLPADVLALLGWLYRTHDLGTSVNGLADAEALLKRVDGDPEGCLPPALATIEDDAFDDVALPLFDRLEPTFKNTIVEAALSRDAGRRVLERAVTVPGIRPALAAQVRQWLKSAP